MKRVLLMGLALATAAGCEASYTKQRKQVLAELSSQVIVPTTAKLATACTALTSAATALATTPTADTLQQTQVAWRAARALWKACESFLLGKDMPNNLRPHLDFWPAGTAKLDTNLAGTETLNQAFVESSGTNAQGFLALEYLLFDSTKPDSVLTALTDSATGERRRAYVVALSSALAVQCQALATQWDDQHFLPKFVNAGTDTSEYASPKAAIGDVINRMTYMAQKIDAMKLQKPLGLVNGTSIDPSLEESPLSDSSLDDINNSLLGVRALYFSTYAGVTGYSLSDLIALRASALDKKVRGQFDAATAAIAAIPAPLRTALTDDAQPIYDAEPRVHDLYTTFNNEVASNQGATISFSDADGD